VLNGTVDGNAVTGASLAAGSGGGVAQSVDSATSPAVSTTGVVSTAPPATVNSIGTPGSTTPGGTLFVVPCEAQVNLIDASGKVTNYSAPPGTGNCHLGAPTWLPVTPDVIPTCVGLFITCDFLSTETFSLTTPFQYQVLQANVPENHSAWIYLPTPAATQGENLTPHVMALSSAGEFYLARNGAQSLYITLNGTITNGPGLEETTDSLPEATGPWQSGPIKTLIDTALTGGKGSYVEFTPLAGQFGNNYAEMVVLWQQGYPNTNSACIPSTPASDCTMPLTLIDINVIPSGSSSIANSIVAGNTAAADPDAAGVFTDTGGNLIGATDGTAGFTTSTLLGTAASPLDPLLMPLGNYSGPTETMLPLPESPALNAGNVNNLGSLTTDQRGQPRNVSGVDAGADEFQGTVVTASSGTPQSAYAGLAFAAPLTATATEAHTGVGLTGATVTFVTPSSGASATLSSGSVTTGSGGVAAVTATANAIPGAYDVTANSGSASAQFALTNTALIATTSTAAVSPSSTFVYNQQPTVSAAVRPSVAMGVLTAKLDGTTPLTITPGTGGMYSIELPATPLTVGTHTIALAFTGTGMFASSTGSLSLTVKAPSYVVNTAADDATGIASHCTSSPEGVCTLRDALAAAASAGAAEVTFAASAFPAPNGATITLTGAPLNLPADTTIAGPTTSGGSILKNLVTVNGGGSTGIFIEGSGITGAEIENLNITDGAASSGGGIDNDGTLTVAGSVFTANRATPYGGGIYNQGTLTVTNCTFSENIASSGAGVFSVNGALTVTNSTFSGNAATDGGAIFSTLSVAEIADSTFSRNTATSFGGAIENRLNATMTVSDNTFSANTATGTGSSGGAIYNLQLLTAANNIFVGNGASTGAGIDNGGTSALNASDNVYYRNLDGGTTEDDCNGCTSNTGAISGNPMLATLGNYGGPTQTMVPEPGSVAICAGSATGAASAGITSDQRGVALSLTTSNESSYTGAGGYCPAGKVDVGAVQTDYALSWSASGSVQPSNVVQYATMSPAPAITLDEDGSPFTATAETIPLTLTGSGTLTGGSAVTSAGVATYSSLSVNTPGTGDSLAATLALNPAISTHAPSIAATSGSFTVTSAVTQLAFSAAPAATLTAGSNGGTVKVSEEDSTGTVVTTAADTIALTVTGPNSYSKTYTVAAVAGVATFDVSGAALDAAGGYTYTATSGSYTQAVASETVNAGAASTVSVIAGNNQSATIGTAFAALEVTVEDAHNNPVSGATVSFTAPASGASATFSTPATTDASGETSVTATANGQASTTAYTVTASVSGAATSAIFSLTNTQRATTVTVTPSATALVYGQPVQLTAATAPASVSGSAPTGEAEFYDGTTALTPTAKVSAAEASYTVAVPSVGTHTYAATYLGDTNFSASAKTNAATAVVVSQAASTLTGPATPVSLTYGAGGSISVSVDGQYSGSGIAQPTGTVSYTIGSGAAQTAAITAGAASLMVPTSEAAGTYTVTVSYGGDGNYKAATSLVVDLTINKAAATVTLGDLTQTYTGSPLAATAATTPKNLTVDLTYDGSAAAPAAAGTYAVTATVNDTNYTGSASGTLTIEKAAAVLNVASSPASPVYRGLVTLTGRISPAVAAPASAFSFHIDSGTASSAVVPAATYSAGTVTASYGQLKAGAHTVSLSFSGSSNYQPGASGTAAIAVAQAAPSIAWAPVASMTYGGDLAALLHASASYSGSAVPGTFSYTAQTAQGAAVPVTGATVLAAGSYTLATTFTPSDSTDYKSESRTSPLNVSEAALKATADDATRVYGAANPAFTGAVTGAVNGESFTESFTTAASAASSPGAYAIVPAVSGTDLGDYTLTTANGTLTVTKAATSIALASGSASITPGQSVTLTATIADASSGSTGTPTGTVSFYDGTALLGTKTLSGGAAVYTTTSLAAAATHALTAVYSGDSNFTGSSTSAGVDVVVAPLNFTVTLASPGTLTIPPGGTASYQVKVTPTYGAYAGTVRFQASGLPPGATATFSPASIPANGGPQTVTVTISMPATVAAIHRPSAGSRLAPVAFAVLLLPFAGGLRKRGRKLSRLICVLLLTVSGAAAIAGLTGCGEHNGYFAQPQKSYTVTMTATAGSLQRTAVVTVDVE
jgi:hypothetical protein